MKTIFNKLFKKAEFGTKMYVAKSHKMNDAMIVSNGFTGSYVKF